MNEIIMWLLAGLTFIPVNIAKSLLGTEGKVNVWILSGFSVVVALTGLLVSGEVALADFSLDDLQALAKVVGQVIAGATLVYKLAPEKLASVGEGARSSILGQ